MIRPRGVSERRKPSPGRAAGALVCARVSWPPGDAVAGPLGDERRSKCAMAPKTWKTSSPHGAGRAGRRGAGRGSRRARSPWCRRRGPAPPSQYRSIPGRVLRGILGGPRILFHGVRTASVTTRSSRSTGPPRARIRIGVGIRWTDGKLGRVARDSDRLYVDPPLEPGRNPRSFPECARRSTLSRYVRGAGQPGEGACLLVRNTGSTPFGIRAQTGVERSRSCRFERRGLSPFCEEQAQISEHRGRLAFPTDGEARTFESGG